jgi:hypothetical protein
MEGLRLWSEDGFNTHTPCSRCQATGCAWDRVAGKPICPDCQESLVVGEGAPLIERMDRRACAVCSHVGSLRYLTLPLHTTRPLEFDLCSRHFRALLMRRLDPAALAQLTRGLQTLGLVRRQVFLLHEVFYDESGRPLQPVPDLA